MIRGTYTRIRKYSLKAITLIILSMSFKLTVATDLTTPYLFAMLMHVNQQIQQVGVFSGLYHVIVRKDATLSLALFISFIYLSII